MYDVLITLENGDLVTFRKSLSKRTAKGLIKELKAKGRKAQLVTSKDYRQETDYTINEGDEEDVSDSES